MSQAKSTIQQRVRFEEVTPAHECVAFLDGSIESLVTPLNLPVYEGYDDLDEMKLVFLTLPSGKTLTLGQYAHSPQAGVDLYVDLRTPDIAVVVWESCQELAIPRSEIQWLHPDFEEKINALYTEHGDIEKRQQSSEQEELSQDNQYEPIDCFHHALQIYTRPDFPEYWAMLQHNLGLAYADRTQGDRFENLQQSIKCFKQSLEIYTVEKFPEKWQINQEDLSKSRQILQPILDNLNGADLIRGNLLGADLLGADLSGANLIGANLIGADLLGANLSGANLIGANLSGANLIGADLSRANLSGANLSGADLIFAELRKTNLSGANVTKTQFQFNRGISELTRQDLIYIGLTH